MRIKELFMQVLRASGDVPIVHTEFLRVSVHVPRASLSFIGASGEDSKSLCRVSKSGGVYSFNLRD